MYGVAPPPCFVDSLRTACSLGEENINDTGIYFSQCGMKFHSVEITTTLSKIKSTPPQAEISASVWVKKKKSNSKVLARVYQKLFGSTFSIF